MKTGPFPEFTLPDWSQTQSSLQSKVKLLSLVRAALSPPQKHYGHHSLRVDTTGLSTTPMPAGSSATVATVSLRLDLAGHRIVLEDSEGGASIMPLAGRSASTARQWLLTALRERRVSPVPDFDELPDDSGQISKDAVSLYWHGLCNVDLVFQQFKAGLREETSSVQFWVDHFDLAMLWFSGGRVPGHDPANPEYADEQMNFGFAPGDQAVAEPYFYATAYPLPDGYTDSALPKGGRWHHGEWHGAVFPYAELTKSANAAEALLDFLTSAQKSGARAMRT